MKLHFEKLSRFAREQEPCSVSVPFSRGKVFPGLQYCVTNNVVTRPAQTKTLSLWDDGSVKWLFVRFLADLPANAPDDYYLQIADDETAASLAAVNADFDRLQVELGATVHRQGAGKVVALNDYISNKPSAKSGDEAALKRTDIFKRVSFNGEDFGSANFELFTVKDASGKVYYPAIGREGFVATDAGPVSVSFKASGKHVADDGAEFLDFELALTFFSGKSYFQADYRILNSSENAAVISGMKLAFTPNGAPRGQALAHSNYKSKIETGERLYKLIDSEHMLYEANEHMPEVFYGTFWGAICGEKNGMCITLHQAHQNFPKAIAVDGKLTAELFPETGDTLTLAPGMAKTHTVFFHFFEAGTPVSELNIRSLQFQLPDRPVLTPDDYKNAGVLENVFSTQRIKDIEKKLTGLADYRGRAYGILHWGDYPDPGYTTQGRGNGEPVWTNNEYDYPHAAMLMYARTCERRYLDNLIVAAKHWQDVDVIHTCSDPLRRGAHIEHSAGHVSGPVEISHEWTEGLLDYYHQTGDEFAYKTALGIGENILYHLSQPKYHNAGEINARETGWAMRALIGLYKETYDEKWLKPCEMIVGHFRQWRDAFGGWFAPYTDHTVIRVPFMISIAVGSLYRYYEITKDAEVRDMIINAVDDLIENCMQDDGLFYYKELPSLRRLGNNPIPLEALVAAYELTGDKKYLYPGVETFFYNTNGIGLDRPTGKKILGDAVLYIGTGTKGFAQGFYPLVRFYIEAVNAGLLQAD